MQRPIHEQQTVYKHHVFYIQHYALFLPQEILIRKAPRHGLSSGSISGLLITIRGPSWPEQIDALAIAEAKISSDSLLHKAFYGSGDKGTLTLQEKSGIENWIFDPSGMVRFLTFSCHALLFLTKLFSFFFPRTMRILQQNLKLLILLLLKRQIKHLFL